MADLNKVFLMGRLTFDPELRRTPNGTGVAELRLATTRSWSGRDGERKEETLYVDVTVWDRQAENCCQYLRKGSAIHVEGSLRMDVWEDKNTGEKRSKIRVQADRVQFLDSRRGDSGSAPGGGPDDDYAAPPPAREQSGSRGPSSASRPSSGQVEARGVRAASNPNASVSNHETPGGPPEGDEEDIPF
jgi:single-strand DNA-binding protein